MKKGRSDYRGLRVGLTITGYIIICFNMFKNCAVF